MLVLNAYIIKIKDEYNIKFKYIIIILYNDKAAVVGSVDSLHLDGSDEQFMKYNLGGLLFQGGYRKTSSYGTFTITFNQSYTTIPFVVASYYNSSGTICIGTQVRKITTTDCRISAVYTGYNPASITAVVWLAIGGAAI